MSEREVVRMVFGSHVYGTSTPQSDKDYKAVFVPEADDILLARATKTSRNKSTGDPNGKNTAEDVDIEEFSLQGYLKLLCEGQTVAVDMLFVPQQHILKRSEMWAFIEANRQEFISKAIAPFIGYCRTQANKYGIKGSRMAAAKAAAETLRVIAAVPDVRLNSFMPYLEETLIKEHPEHICFEDKKHPGGAIVRHLSVCGRLSPETLRVDRAAEMYERLWQDYGDRARQAMNNDGIDWKALMHARRICDQAQELLATGKITFPRPNADDLLKIRLGELPYATVAEQIETGMAQLEVSMKESKLRAEPNRKLAERIVLDAYRRAVVGNPR